LTKQVKEETKKEEAGGRGRGAEEARQKGWKRRGRREGGGE